MSCLDENTVVRYLDGVLSQHETLGVERHVDACSTCRMFLAEVVRFCPEEKQVQEALSTIKSKTSESFRHYTIKGEYGKGGQARIMLAFDEIVGREVVLKELPPPRISPDSGSSEQPASKQNNREARFLHEARITGQLSHPNMVPVYEIGRGANGQLYYTMQLVRGRPLAQALRLCSRLDQRMHFLGNFLSICQAVAYAHSRGIVHRDIKPQNVMVGEFGETILLDWGLAKVSGKEEFYDQHRREDLCLVESSIDLQTMEGTALGTPAYMSPEQAQGRIEDIDEQSDIYGLGAVLYEILTGKPPHTGKSLPDPQKAVKRGNIRPVVKLCPQAPVELVAVVEKALSGKKTDRYQKVSDLADEVDAFMTGRRVTAYSYSSWELLKRFTAQNKPAFYAASIVLTVLLTTLVLVLLALRAETRARESENLALKREQKARVAERAERDVSHYHLAQAYLEKSVQMIDEHRYVAARVFAAASLIHNPSNPRGSYYNSDFPNRFAQSRDLWVDAASRVFWLGFHPSVEQTLVFKADELFNQMDFSPSGRFLAAGNYDGKVRIWDITQGKLARVLQGHSGPVYQVAYSPDGQCLASSSRGKSGVIIWQAETDWKPKVLDSDYAGGVLGVTFSPDGRILSGAGRDGKIRIWNARSGEQIQIIRGHNGRVYRTSFSTDGRRLASAGADRKVKIWSLDKGRQLHELAGHTDHVLDVSFSPDGRYLASAGGDRVVRIWNPATGKVVSVLEGHQDLIGALAFSPNGNWLATASIDDSVRLWDVKKLQTILNIGHFKGVRAVAFSAGEERMAVAGFDKSIRVWNIHRGRPLTYLIGAEEVHMAIAFAPNGRLIAAGNWGKSVYLWESTTGRLLQELQGHTDVVLDVAFNPDSKRLASSGADRTVRVWDTETGHTLLVLEGHRDNVDKVVFSPDGRALATSGRDKTIRVWDSTDGSLIRILRGHENFIPSIAFTPDGKRLVSASYDETVRIWDPESGEQERKLVGHTDWVQGVDVSPDGHRIASCGKDGQVILWDAKTGEIRKRFSGRTNFVYWVYFSTDGRRLATGGNDGRIRLWSAQTHELQLILDEMGPFDLSPDGKIIAVGVENKIKLYPIELSIRERDPQQLLKSTERAAGIRLKGLRLESIE